MLETSLLGGQNLCKDLC